MHRCTKICNTVVVRFCSFIVCVRRLEILGEIGHKAGNGQRLLILKNWEKGRDRIPILHHHPVALLVGLILSIMVEISEKLQKSIQWGTTNLDLKLVHGFTTRELKSARKWVLREFKYTYGSKLKLRKYKSENNKMLYLHLTCLSADFEIPVYCNAFSTYKSKHWPVPAKVTDIWSLKNC